MYIDDIIRSWKMKNSLGKDYLLSAVVYTDDMTAIQESEDDLQRALLTFTKKINEC